VRPRAGHFFADIGIVAGVGDILAGLGAATLIGRPTTRAQLRRVHLFGFADFISAVGTGLSGSRRPPSR
jgi:hypothetical protein